MMVIRNSLLNKQKKQILMLVVMRMKVFYNVSNHY